MSCAVDFQNVSTDPVGVRVIGMSSACLGWLPGK